MITMMDVLPDQSQRHRPAIRLLHWLVVILVVVVFPAGMLIELVAKEFQGGFYLVHESLGFLILWVMLLRLAVRLRRPAPPAPWLGGFARRAGGLVHGLLYACLILQPMLGFLMTNAFGFPLSWFGLVEVPSPLAAAPDLAPALKTAHGVVGWLILGLLALHLGAVFWHHLIRRDATLYRIL